MASGGRGLGSSVASTNLAVGAGGECLRLLTAAAVGRRGHRLHR